MALVGAPGVKTSRHAQPLELVGVLRRDRAADDDEDITRVVLAETLYDPRHQRHVRARENRDPDRVRVLLDRGLDDLLRRLVEARVDDLHAGVAQRPRDDLRSPIVPVQPGLRDHDPNRPLHAVSIGTCASSSSGRPRPGRTRAAPIPATSSSRRASGSSSTAAPASSAGCGNGRRGRPSTRSRSRTFTSTTGAISSRGSGAASTGGATTTCARRSGCTGAGGRSSRSSARASASPTCSSGRSPCRSTTATRRSTAAGLEVLPVRLPHYRLETYGFRVTNGGATLAYTGDTGPSERIAELARDVDLFVCEATLETGEADGQPRGHLSAEEALESYAASGARNLLLTHRPSELPTPEGIVLAYDGMELEVVPSRSTPATDCGTRPSATEGKLRPRQRAPSGVCPAAGGDQRRARTPAARARCPRRGARRRRSRRG